MTWRLSGLRCAWAAKPHDTSETVKSEVVSIADIEGAERLVGIAYTAAEREQMVDRVLETTIRGLQPGPAGA